MLFLGAVGGGRIATPMRLRPHAAEPSASSLIQSFDGPLIVTSSLSRQRELFEGVLGLSLAADQELGPDAVAALFGVAGRTARSVLLETKGTSVGVRLVEFRPSSLLAVRDQARPFEVDALASIGFLAPDLHRAREALATRGISLDLRTASYSTTEGGRISEGQFEGPDGVVCTVGHVHGEPLSNDATVTERAFSEIATVRAAVSDRASAHGFYGETLGLQTVRTRETARQGILLRSVDFSTGSMAPRIELIDYSPRPPTSRSLRDRSVLPHRGLQALRFSVSSVDAVARAAAAAGVEITAPTSETLLFPQGRVRSILIRAPHGVLHHFTETLRT